MKKVCLFILFAGTMAIYCPFSLWAQADSVPPRVEIPNTQVLKLASSIANQEYQLLISLPGNYKRDSAKSYPVVYLLDGQYDFPFLTGVYGGQYYDGFLPELIIVGITWGGKDPDAGMLRGRDFTPTHIPEMSESGNGPKFLEFIKKELIPFIGSKYRVTEDRTLTGSSLGGLFTLYALFTDPSLFHRYVLTSPSIGWDKSMLRPLEEKYEANGSATPVRLFMGVGELEGDISGFQQLAERLKQKKVRGLELQTTVIANTGHAGTKPEGFARGLQYVFGRPSLLLSPAILGKYTGTYLAGTDTLRIITEKGKLVALAGPDDKIIMEAESEKDFYVKGAFVNIHFKEDQPGKTSGFQLVQFQGEIFVKKLN